MFDINNKSVIKDENKINELISRGVENIFPNKDFLKSRLMEGKRLTFYLGIDPTGKTLHLGHVIPLRKLAKLQNLGHQIILLIGDFTAMIGDPTDKTATRKKLTRKEVLDNCKSYKKQASKFISFSGSNKALLKFNSKWFNKMNFSDVLDLTSLMTVEQMLKRDMFAKRMEEGKPVYIHEFLYPLMQGFDSVSMDVDGEVGGNDQTFNMLTGRDLLKTLKNKEKFVIATKLLADSSGLKMGKTEGNMVSLDQTSEDMFGRVMSWDDKLILPAFEMLTDIPMQEIDSIKSNMQNGSNPRDFKVKLAKEIVSMIFDNKIAEKAHESFENTFRKGEVPENIPEIIIPNGNIIKEAIVNSKIVSSNTEWRRLIDENAISIMNTNEIIKDPYIKADKDLILRIGKKRFVKIIVK